MLRAMKKMPTKMPGKMPMPSTMPSCQVLCQVFLHKSTAPGAVTWYCTINRNSIETENTRTNKQQMTHTHARTMKRK